MTPQQKTAHLMPETERHAASIKTTWISALVNTLLSIGQVIAGWLTGSFGLIADGIHTLSDLIADFVVLLAANHSRKGADEDHHYGHARYENAASLFLGVILLCVAAFMVWSAVLKLHDWENLPDVKIAALWAAIVALICKECLFRYMLSVAHRVGSSMLIANAWHARSDALSSLVVAIGITGNLLGYPLLDPLAALLVGGMVGKMGWQFSVNAFHDLTDRALPIEEMELIDKLLMATPGVVGIHDLRARKMGDLAIVDVHIDVDGQLTVQTGHDIAVDARRRVMECHRVQNVMVHVDPV